MIPYFHLLRLIFTHGKLRHTGEDFNAIRGEGLRDLQEFIPADNRTVKFTPAKKGVIQMLRSQAAYVRDSFTQTGGHITAENLAYIRIPKAASTSAGKMMLEKLYPALGNQTITEHQVNFLMDANLEKMVSGNSTSFFTIVRNPFARLVSVYRDFFENPAHFIYTNYLFGILEHSLSFAEFVDRISAIPHQLMDQHFKPQHTFVSYYEGHKISVSVFKLEKPEKLSEFLTNHDLSLPHLNQTSPVDLARYYTPATFEKVYTLYRADIEKFGYESEANQLKSALATVQK